MRGGEVYIFRKITLYSLQVVWLGRFLKLTHAIGTSDKLHTKNQYARIVILFTSFYPVIQLLFRKIDFHYGD